VGFIYGKFIVKDSTRAKNSGSGLQQVRVGEQNLKVCLVVVVETIEWHALHKKDMADVPPFGAWLLRTLPGVSESFIKSISEISDVCVYLKTIGLF
jgi:hypothetical protein